jgi:UMF1 family MFS transporter
MDKAGKKLTRLEKYWIMYDVGNSAFIMLISTIIPIYFKNIAQAGGISAANSTAYWGYAISISTIIVAVLGPILGTLADTKGYKKPLFTVFFMLGVLGCASLAVPMKWVAFLAVFIIAKVGISGSFIFYDAMLSDVTNDDRMDVLSSQGYAWGYIGSCIPFTASLLIVLSAEKLGLKASAATGIAFIINALWWFFITIPLLKNYRQLHYVEVESEAVKKAFGRLINILAEIKKK